MSWAERVAGPRAIATASTPRHLLKPMSVQVKQVLAGSGLEAVLAAAAKRPPSNEDSPLPPVARFLGGFRRSFVTGRRNIDELNGCAIIGCPRLDLQVLRTRGNWAPEIVLQIRERGTAPTCEGRCNQVIVMTHAFLVSGCSVRLERCRHHVPGT